MFYKNYSRLYVKGKCENIVAEDTFVRQGNDNQPFILTYKAAQAATKSGTACAAALLAKL